MKMSAPIEYTAKIVKGDRVLHETQFPTQNPYRWAHVQGRVGFDVLSVGKNGNAQLMDEKGRKAVLIVKPVEG